MVFIIWTNRGPLQYAGLLLFLLQFAPPFVSRVATVWQLPAVNVAALLGGLVGGIAAGLWYAGRWRRVVDSYGRAWRWLVETTGLPNHSGILWLVAAVVGAVGALLVRWMWNQSPSTLISLAQLVMAGFMVQAQLGQQRNVEQQLQHGNEEQRMAELVELVRTLPMEEFVPEGDMQELSTTSTNDERNDSADRNKDRHHLSIPQLKRMLKRRGRPTHEFVERSELLQALEQCRNYAETCCICCEDYQRGDPIRVLPKCRHEFHVECLDQWAYTFAQRKYQQHQQKRRTPTCPLCNTPLR